jgi:hypothetical protein
MILIYVKGTTSFGIHYATRYSSDLAGYIDSYWAGDSTDHNYMGAVNVTIEAICLQHFLT